MNAIEQEVAREPTPDNVSALIDLYRAAGSFTKAQEFLDQALAKWPDNTRLLLAAYQLNVFRRDPAGVVQILPRIEPGNARLAQMLAQTRAAAQG